MDARLGANDAGNSVTELNANGALVRVIKVRPTSCAARVKSRRTASTCDLESTRDDLAEVSATTGNFIKDVKSPLSESLKSTR